MTSRSAILNAAFSAALFAMATLLPTLSHAGAFNALGAPRLLAPAITLGVACGSYVFPYTLAGNTPTELTEAIECANLNGSADVIDLNGQTVTLTTVYANYSGDTGLPQITTDITLRNGTITRSGATQFRLLNASNTATLRLNNLTLANGGGATYSNEGGAIRSTGGLLLNQVTITGNQSSVGGAAIAITAMPSVAPLQIFESTLSNNTSLGGSAIYFAPGITTSILINRSTFAGNLGSGGPGAIFVSGAGASMNVVNSTFSANSSSNSAAPDAIGAFSSAVLFIRFSTFSGHDNGSSASTTGIIHAASSSQITMQGSVIANNIRTGGGTARECTASSASFIGTSNYAADTFCPGRVAAPIFISTTLANNGGPTQTHLPAPYSNIVNADSGNLCGPANQNLVLDQRNQPRPRGPACDLGAVEIDACGSITFPYTVPDNTPATLNTAIDCANSTSSTSDLIDLNGQTITLTASAGDAGGATGLVSVRSPIIIRNGTITRTGPNEFRLLNVDISGNLTLRDMTLTNGGGSGFVDAGSLISSNSGSTLNIVRSTLSGGIGGTGSTGGAIFASGALNVVNSSIRGNVAGRGGAIAAQNGPLVISNSVISGNVASNTTGSGGGAVFLTSMTVNDARILNSTITGNYASGTGTTRAGGIVGDASAGVNLFLHNSIVWGNSNSGGAAPQIVNTAASSTNTASNSIIQDGQFGALNAAPLFTTPLIASATASTLGNFALLDDSPGIDAGANVNVPTDVFDINGNTNTGEDAPDLLGNLRRYNDTGVTDTGSGTAPIVDIGALEKQTNSIDPCATIIFPYTLPNNLPATLTTAIECANANGSSTDVINLNGQTITLTASYADYTGATGLPQITTPVTLQNGTVTRGGANQFRILAVSPIGNLGLTNMEISNGHGFAPGSVGGAGAIYSEGTVNVADSRVVGNYSELDGGAIHNAGGSFYARNSVFSANLTNVPGGGVGGALANSGGVVTLFNVLVSGNRAVQGGGIYNNSGGLLELTNTTIAGNLTNDQGGGLRNENTDIPVVLNNTLISGNSSTVFPALSDVGGAVTNNFSRIGGSPSYVAPAAPTAAPTTTGNYRLGDGSVMVDAGSNALMVLASDLDNNPRRYDDTGVADTGSGTAPLVDIGAYEKQTNTPPVQADLAITKTDGVTVEDPGTAVTYTITASNAGPANASSATVADTFPAGISGVTWTCVGAGGGSCSASGSGNINATVNLPVGASVTFTATGTISAAATGTLSNTATVTSALPDPAPGNNSATDTDTLSSVADLSITVVDSPDPVLAGNDLSYTVNVSNAGTAAAGNAQWSTTLPAALGYQSLSASAGWSCTTPALGASGALSCTRGSFAVGSASFTLVARVAPGTAGGTVVPLTATVSSATNDLVPGNNSASASTTVSAAPTVLVTPASLNVDETGPTSSAFTVRLSTAPASNVTIALSFPSAQVQVDSGAGFGGSPQTLTLTPANALAGVSVGVRAVDDAIDEASPHAVTVVTASTSSSEPAFNGLPVGDVAVNITDNDNAAISLVQSGGDTAVTEGGTTDSYTLVLTSQPSANVSIALTGNQVTPSPTPIVFTSANWNTPQTVTVTAIDDAVVEGAHAGSITSVVTSGDAGYNGFALAPLSVAITDNDSVGISVVQSAGNTAVTEGGATDSYTLVLSSQPTANVSIALAGTQVTPSPTPVVFTPANWNTPQTVTVTAIDDAVVEGAHSGSVTSVVTSGDSGYNGFSIAPVSVAITDNDSAAITLVQSGGTTAVAEGGATDSYTLVLTSQPSANVSIALTGTQVTTSPTTVVFTSANWNSPQSVTVTAIDDAIAEGAHAGSISSVVTSSDAGYNGQSIAALSVTITDNDTAAISLVQSGGTTAVTEGGATDSYTLVLTSQPTANVSIALAGTQVTASPTPVVFTSANWNTPQTVTVTAIDDAIAEGLHSGSITSVVTSSDTGYNGQSIAALSVAITDNDNAAISLVQSGGNTAVTEGGATDSYTLVLTSQPTADVSIALTGTQVTTSPTTILFTPATWNVAQTVTVTAIDDAIAEGAHSGSITSVVTSGDAGYNGFALAPVSVAITDNDNAGISLVQSGGNTAVAEGGATDSYTLVLTSQPTANVSIALTGTQVTPSPTPVVFTTANWNTPQTVTVTAIDDAIVEGAHTGSVTSAVTSSDTSYQGFALAPLSVAITDNDVPGVSVLQSGGNTAVAEGGASDSLTVVLQSQPSANVTITLTGSQITPSPTPLSFTSANWNMPQTVTITAIDDAIDEASPHAGQLSFAVASSDANYQGFVVTPVAVDVTDNDTAGITLVESAGSTAATEGGATDIYTLVLSSQPTANVAIALSVGAQAQVSPGTVSFTAANWNTPQTVTVNAVDDSVVEGPHAATISHGVSSSDPNYSGFVLPAINVAITDNDSAVVNFSAANVSQSEGTSPMAYTVTLSNPVQSGVTLTLNSTNGSAGAADYTPISGGTVSFAANSNTSQTVNVIINNDALDEDDETYSLTLSGLTATGNVTLGTATANATILDDDATPTISISSPSQNEGNSGSAPMNFTVSLSAVSGRAVSFSAATANGTATAPSDYLALTATPQTIPAGQSSLTLPVTINGDASFEGNESFSLQLTGISNATPATLSGTGTILEDDQQPTTTVISSDLPDPSVVGQPYPVAVTVTAQSSSPTGTVNVSDGSASCTITLTAATSPSSTGSCNLTSTTAGAKTLTASYTASSTNFGNSSGTTTHQVNAAATTISVSGPARSRINQPTAFSFALAVTSPGAGTPSGTVTLSSGSSSCTATLPATSCNLTFTALGNRTVSVSYAGDGNYASSSSSGAGNTQTLVYALSDLAVTKTDVVTTFEPDDLLVYTVTVRNLGPDTAEQIRILDNVPAGLNNVTWSCDASGGVACPVPGGSGNLDLTIANFPTGGLLNFTFYGNAAGATVITNTALVELPADTTVEDPELGNNSATDVNVYEPNFRDGFEDPQVNAATGSVRLPASALRSLLDANARVVYTLRDARGTALRLYARVHNDRSQYALALRTTQGPLRLGNWQSLDGDPQLSWTAASDVGGWVLSGASLR